MQDSSRGLRKVGKAANQLRSAQRFRAGTLAYSFLLFPSFPITQISYQLPFPSSCTHPRHSNNFPAGIFFPRHRWQVATCWQRIYVAERRATRSESAAISSRTHRQTNASLEPTYHIMKVIVKQWHAIAQWQWDTGKTDENGDPEEDVCGICRVPFEGCCPTCKVPGDDCPLSRSFLLQTHLPAAADDPFTFSSMGRV
jgi:hypothetical protein